MGKEKTIIKRQIAVEGSLQGKEDLEIMGSVKGCAAVPGHTFFLGRTGKFEGEVLARNVKISGEIKGKIRASNDVKITRQADFYGDIKAKHIAVEDGACFKGVVVVEREAASGSKSVTEKTAAAAGPDIQKTQLSKAGT